MTDIVIKPSNSGGSVKLQTEGGTNGLTMASTGDLTTSGNVAVTGTMTGGTLGTGVTNNAGVASGTIASGVTIASGINMPDFDWNLSSGENRIITFGSKGFALYGVVDSTGTGNSSARTGVYGNSSSSSNAVGEGTLSPTANRWSAQTNSSEDYELQLASPDGGTFYYYFFGIRS